MTEIQARKTTLESIFRRKGGNGNHTLPFDKFSPDTQRIMLNQISLNENEELPIVACFRSSDKWVMITTNQIAWASQNKMMSLPFIEIQEVKPPDFQKIKKENWQFLNIETFSHNTHMIEFEEGPALLGVWNLLKNVVRRNYSQTKS